MPRLLMAYFATIVVFFAIDFIWLTTIAVEFYQNQIGPLLLESFRAEVAILFYLVYLAGVVYFAVNPALKAKSVGLALMNGALFGFFCYATYDFTNLATLKGYTMAVALVDVTWGSALTGISAMIGTWTTIKIMG